MGIRTNVMERNLLGYTVCVVSAYLKLKFLKCRSPYVICLNKRVELLWLLKFNHIQKVRRLNMAFLLKGKWDVIGKIFSFKWENFFIVWYACDLDRPYHLHLSFSLLLTVLCILGFLKCEILGNVQCSVMYQSFL